MTKALKLALLASLFAQPVAVFAQEQQSFRSVIGRGFEIKSVTFLKGETSDNREAFLVTLQMGKQVAVCYFAATSWINLSKIAMEDAKRCDVR